MHLTDYFFHFITEHPSFIAMNALFMQDTHARQYYEQIENETINYMLDHNMIDYEGLQELCDNIGYEKVGVDDIKQVTKTKFKKDIPKDENCSICMESFHDKKRNVYLVNCNHYFCFECIDKWLKENKGCPICKQEVVKSPPH
jgi:hypothetical protein